MKLSILQENLHHGLSIVSRFVATRAQLPVLGNVLLTTEKQRLKLTTTNLETGINYWVGAKIEEEGSISVPAKLLSEFLNSLPADKIDIETKDNNFSLKSAGFQANLIGIAGSEFPVVPTNKEKPKINLNIKNLTQTLSQVVFAAAQDEGRPVLGGVLLKIKGSELLLVATDGYRLSLKKFEELKDVANVPEFQKGLLIPAKTLSEVSRLITEKDQLSNLGLTITPEANQTLFTLNDAEIVSRLIEGEFPDFEKIIPESGTTKVTFDKDQFLRAVKISALFARESANIIRLQIKKNAVVVSANAPQLGDNVSQIEAKLTGDENSIAFNSRYLLEYLSSINCQTITLESSGALNPGVFTTSEDKSYLHIIMPVRVQE